MRKSKNKNSTYVWVRGSSSTKDSMYEDSFFDMKQLKSATKKIAIMSRMQNREKSQRAVMSQARPNTVNPSEGRRIRNFRQASKVYRAEKKKYQNLIEDDKTETKTLGFQSTAKSNYNIEGLLGQYEKYQKMSKKELIEKLISLEYLANNIFKRNKHLEQRIKEVSNQ